MLAHLVLLSHADLGIIKVSEEPLRTSQGSPAQTTDPWNSEIINGLFFKLLN